jgi:aryl-alcohol dehydrogenase-like predicted oxidoreductase
MRRDGFEPHRLAIGTVQFGMAYGIANARGQVPSDEVSAILREASMAGVTMLDTAIAYGEAEAIVGRALAAIGCTYAIVTKVPKGMPASAIAAAVEGSCERLGVRKLHGLLLHDASDASAQPGLVDALVGLQRRGLVDKLGASLYRPADLDVARAAGLPLELLQVPFSALDQRFAPHLPSLLRAGVEVHVRSVFLQGLLLLPPARVAERFPAAVVSRVAELHALAAALAVPVPALLLGAAALRPEIGRIVMGIDSLANLRENVEALAAAGRIADLGERLKPFAFDDEDVLMPSRWRS